MATANNPKPPRNTLQKVADAATRALGRWIDPWFNPKYISPHIQNAAKNAAINTVGPTVEEKHDAQAAKTAMLREKLYTTFQGGQLRFLPMDDGVTDETPEMRSEYLKMFLKEPSIKAAMMTKYISVVASKMSIIPASEDPMDKEASKWINNVLMSQRGGIRKMGENLLLFALCSGHSLNEKIYHVEHKRQFAHLFPHGYIGLKQLKVKKPEDYRLEVDQFRNIRGVWSNRASRRFDPSYFVITSFMPMYENPAGTSDLRSAIRAYNLILMAQQLRSIWCEQFSMPYMEGTYPPGDMDAKAFVEAAIQQLRSLGWYVVPQGTTIRAIEASAKGETEFQMMIDDLRKEIYLCIVGSYLQAMEGATVGGAGDSSVHKSTQELFTWYLCELLADTVNDQIIPDLMGMNLSGMENPRVSFAGTSDGDLLQGISIYQAAKQLGIDLSKKKIYQKFEIDPPEDDADKLPGDTQQSMQPGGGMGGAPAEGAAPNPLDALKMAEDKPTEGMHANGAKVLWQLLKFFRVGILSDVALMKEMRVGPNGLTDYGTIMRTARYHGIYYRDIDDPAIFEMEKELNSLDRLALVNLKLGEDVPDTFALITRCDLKNDEISILMPDGKESTMSPDEFLDHWGQGKRRMVVFSTVNDVETPDAPAKQSEEGDDDDDDDVGDAGKDSGDVPGSGVGPRNAVHEDDIPAGPDGRDVYTLLNESVKHGRSVVTAMAKKAATRMLESGNTDQFFNADEQEELAEALEECLAPADLLGRASVMLRLEKARAHSDKIDKFSEQPAGLLQTFAERKISPMKPSQALKYFQQLVPSMTLKYEKWKDTLKRKTFTMAEATNKTIVDRVKKAIERRVAAGDTVTGAQAIEDILDRVGIHPRNPQYCDMVFRTNYMDIFNVAAEEQRQDPDVVDDFPVWRYMGIRDGRQGKDHEEHFDNYYPAKVSFQKVRGDRVYNCRCQAVPVYKAEWAKLKARGKKVSKFSESVNFGEWEENKHPRASDGRFGNKAGDKREHPHINTPEFKAWFKDSKVVDEQGKPKVVYHKTSADFESFDKNKAGANDYGYAGKGFYFSPETSNKEGDALSYGNRTMPVFLSLQNPYIRTMDNWNKDKLNPYTWIPERAQELMKAKGKAKGDYEKETTAQASHEWTEMMKAKGYDGFIDQAVKGGEIVAFEPSQIKSAIANKGSYDPSNPALHLSESIEGGLADGKQDSEFDPAALAKGMDVEREHTSDDAVAKEIAKDHLTEDPEYYDKLDKMEKMSEDDDEEPAHDYCSTQFNLPHAVGLKVMGMADRIKDEDLAEKGREDDPHITVLYGIHDPGAVDAIGDMLLGQKPIICTLRRTSVFEHDDCDVVKLNVDSPELHELRYRIEQAIDNTQTFPHYQPHVTLAYVKKGLGKKYVDMLDMEGAKVILKDFCFCGQDEEKTEFKLGVTPNQFDEIYRGPNPPGDRKNWQQLQPGPKGGKRWRRVEKRKPAAQASPQKHSKKPEAKSGKLPNKAPGSQLSEQQRNKLRKAGMVGTFPPADVPIGDIQFNPNPSDNTWLIKWKQKTKSGRISPQARYTQKFHDTNADKKFQRIKKCEPHLKEAHGILDHWVQDKSVDDNLRDASAIASIIAETGLRPTDNNESIKHGHFGVASLQARHVKIEGSEVKLDFIGKEGVRNRSVIKNPVIVAYIKQKMKGKAGKDFLWSANSSLAGNVLKQSFQRVGGPADVKLKDLRTIKATQVGREVVSRFKGPPPPLSGDDKRDAKVLKTAILSMSSVVAKVLCNTPVMARDNYIHPEVFREWQRRIM